MQYDVVYDVAEVGMSWPRIITLTIMAAVFTWLSVHTVILLTRKDLKQAGKGAVFAAVIGGVGGFIGWHFVSTQRDCERWLAGGDYKTVEGEVVEFTEHRKEYTFKIDGWTFRVPKGNLDYCGYRLPATGESPLKDGVPVRLAFHDASILRIEVAR